MSFLIDIMYLFFSLNTIQFYKDYNFSCVDGNNFFTEYFVHFQETEIFSLFYFVIIIYIDDWSNIL